jgi:two-component system chemotaxis sensor kinase CheA
MKKGEITTSIKLPRKREGRERDRTERKREGEMRRTERGRRMEEIEG